MAEGLQRRIEYSDLKFISAFAKIGRASCRERV